MVWRGSRLTGPSWQRLIDMDLIERFHAVRDAFWRLPSPAKLVLGVALGSGNVLLLLSIPLGWRTTSCGRERVYKSVVRKGAVSRGKVLHPRQRFVRDHIVHWENESRFPQGHGLLKTVPDSAVHGFRLALR